MKKHLWAPWRIEYITSPKAEHCIFCESEGSDQERLVLKKGEHSFIIMNAYPYNNGHLMVVPYEHTSNYGALSSEVKSEMQKFISESIEVLTKAMNPSGFNIGMNLGASAGAGITEHLHWHIVPRWVGDTNFMPVTNHTRVVAEALEETWKKLKIEFNNTL